MKQLLNFPKLLFFLPILLGMFFIWTNLDLKVLHHDESLNAIYGLYYYLNPSSQFYRYDPMLHGPFLYHLLPWVYHLIDESHFAIRFIPAALFTLLPVGIIFGLWKKMKWSSLAIATLLITGPSYIYWARFLRHDQIVLFLLLIMGFAFHPKAKRASPYLFFIPLALQFCTKENAYIHLFFWLGFILFSYIVDNKNLFIIKHLIKNKKHFYISIVISLFIYVFYYTSGFMYSSGILDGLYRKSLFYWMNQHSIERISGPFLTQFFTLFWYELPFILLIFFSVIHLHIKEKNYLKFLPLLIFIIAGFFHLIYGHALPVNSLWNKYAKLKLGLDFYGFLPLIILSISGTWILIKKNRKVEAFFYYWTMASFFTYSYLGEKVPWLSMYILIPGIIFVGIYFKDIKAKVLIPIVTFALCFNIYQAYQLNHVNPGATTEFISQVHTTKAYEKLAIDLKNILDDKNGKKILALKDNTWPLTWYLYKKDGYFYHQSGRELTTFDIVLDSSPTKNKIAGYEKKVIGLRHWWVPDWSNMTFFDFVSYSFNHKPWSRTGTQNVTVFYKDKLLNF